VWTVLCVTALCNDDNYTMVGLNVMESLRAGIAVPEEEEEADAVTEYDEFMYTDAHDTEIHKRSAAHQFVHVHGQSMASVFAMVIGISDYEGILEKEPFCLEKKKDITKEFKPTNEQLIKEILRRSYFFAKDFETMDYNAKSDLSLHPNVNKRGIAKTPKPQAWIQPKLIAWLKERPLKLKPHLKDRAFFERSIATYTTTLEESQQERLQLLPEKVKESTTLETTVLDNEDLSDDETCPAVASDATSSTTTAAKMKRLRDQDMKGLTEEAKKIRKLWTTSVRGDGIRSSIRSLVLEQSTMIQRLTALENREAEYTRNFHTYTLQLCRMAGENNNDSNYSNDNSLAQTAMTGIVDSICADKARVNAEIATIRASATAVREKLVEKEQLLLYHENGNLET
jgi:hypothetical protein